MDHGPQRKERERISNGVFDEIEMIDFHSGMMDPFLCGSAVRCPGTLDIKLLTFGKLSPDCSSPCVVTRRFLGIYSGRLDLDHLSCTCLPRKRQLLTESW